MIHIKEILLVKNIVKSLLWIAKLLIKYFSKIGPITNPIITGVRSKSNNFRIYPIIVNGNNTNKISFMFLLML